MVLTDRSSLIKLPIRRGSQETNFAMRDSIHGQVLRWWTTENKVPNEMLMIILIKILILNNHYHSYHSAQASFLSSLAIVTVLLETLTCLLLLTNVVFYVRPKFQHSELIILHHFLRAFK